MTDRPIDSGADQVIRKFDFHPIIVITRANLIQTGNFPIAPIETNWCIRRLWSFFFWKLLFLSLLSVVCYRYKNIFLMPLMYMVKFCKLINTLETSLSLWQHSINVLEVGNSPGSGTDTVIELGTGRNKWETWVKTTTIKYVQK